MLALFLMPAAACFEDARPGENATDTDTDGRTSQTGDGTTGAATTSSTSASETSSGASSNAIISTGDAGSSSSEGEAESSTSTAAGESSGAESSSSLSDVSSTLAGEGASSSTSAEESSTGDAGASPCPACDSGFCDAEGTCARGVFVSSVTYPGSLGGLTGADAHCERLARAAGLPGDWMAWLSDDRLDAGSRIPGSSDPYVLYDGTLVAPNFEAFRTYIEGDLDAIYLEHAIDQTEVGLDPVPGTACSGWSAVIPVWTSTVTTGEWDTYGTCDAWLWDGSVEEVQEVNLGNALAIDSWWTAFACSETDCGRTASLYCFQSGVG